MTSPDNLSHNQEQNAQLLRSMEETDDKIFHSKYKKEVLNELARQLVALKTKVKTNKISFEDANNEHAVIVHKMDIIRQIEDLQANIPTQPVPPAESSTNPLIQDQWFEEHSQWEIKTQAINDKIRQLEKGLNDSSLFGKLRKLFG